MAIIDLATHQLESVSGGVNPLEILGSMAKGLHALAEITISTLGLQPIFSIIDKPVIHPLLWEPLSLLTGVDVDEHPPGL
jgi:hypothetical protein